MRKLATHKLQDWARRHAVALTRIGFGAFVLLMLLVQFLYPGSQLPLFASVDGINLSGWSKEDAVKRLDSLSAKQQIAVVLGDANKSYATVKPADIGVKVSHKARIMTSSYPWYLRIIPTSLFWFGPLQAEKPATYTADKTVAKKYLEGALGDSCNIPAKDATLKLSEDRLEVVPATDGGICREDDALKALSSTRPVINQFAKVTIPVQKVSPKVGDNVAQKLADSLNRESSGGVVLVVAGKEQSVEQKEVLSWLSFAPKNDTLTFTVDAKKAGPYMAKNVTPKVSKPAGVTKISTLDFTETSRANGASGQTLGLDATLAGVRKVLIGEADKANAVVTTLPPKVEYVRSYTKTSTGIAALLQHYAEDHAGTFGVSFAELGGRGLAASYGSSQSFITASTYKLFVAYGTLTKVDKGEWKWGDQVTGGRDLNTCFDDMIVKSDNACAEALYKKIGYQKVINDVRALGLANTKLSSDGQRTTAADLALFLTKLQNKTLDIKDVGRDRLLGAMKRNVYRSGIPTGASGAVADKVGFLNGLLHDASIVYSPKGTYVLVIMTDGSTWGNIADLTRKIEALR